MNAMTRMPRVATVTKRLQDFVASDNIAADLTEQELSELGSKVCTEYGVDERSNAAWLKTAREALEAALQVPVAKNYPFPNASNIKWPLITVAALQFNARAYPAIVDGDNIVKVQVVGADPDGQKRAKAERVGKHMSFQLTSEMDEWEEDTDTLLMQLPIVGTAFRKVYFDGSLERNKSEMVAGIDVIVNRATKNLESAPRITHRLMMHPLEIQERQLAGLWQKDFDPGKSPAGAASTDADAPHEFYEQHRYIDLDGDGYREPYIVTVHQDSETVVRIVANFGLSDVVMGNKGVRRIKRRHYFVKYGFIPDPKGGFYDIGFGSLLESLGAAIDTTINQMLDAGNLQNAGGGFIGSGVRLKKGMITLEPGVYRTIDASGAKLREAIYNFEHPGPSPVLFNLLGLMIDAAKDITAVQDIMTGDGKDANQTATTTLALIEQGMKVFTAIFKRIHRAMKQEFTLLFRLNAEHLPEESYFRVLDDAEAIKRTDYDPEAYDVCPQADPRLVTDMQRLARAQLLMPFIEANDPLVNQVEARRRVFLAQGQEDIESLMAQPPEPDPMMMAGAEAEVRKANAVATKDEALAEKALADAGAAKANVEMKALGMMQGESQFGQSRADRVEDRAAKAGEKAPVA